MKSLTFSKLFALCLLLFVFVNTGCKKDDDKKSTREQLVGRWTIERLDFVDFIDGDQDVYSEPANPGDYFDFRSDNKLFVRLFGQEGETIWQLTSNDSKIDLSNSTTLDGGTLDIRTLTSNELVLYIKEIDGADYYETTIYMKK